MVPTLAIGDEIVTDTVRIVYRIDRDFDGPRLTPVEPESAEAMGRMMRDIMGLHYGVLMYSRLLDEGGKSPVVVARGNFLREQRSKYPDRASVLDARIAGNERLQAALADPAEIARHVDEARLLVGRIDDALSQTRFVSDDSYTLADTFATAALARFRLQGFEDWWSGGANSNVADLLLAHARAPQLVCGRRRRHWNRKRSLGPAAAPKSLSHHGSTIGSPKILIPRL